MRWVDPPSTYRDLRLCQSFVIASRSYWRVRPKRRGDGFVRGGGRKFSPARHGLPGSKAVAIFGRKPVPIFDGSGEQRLALRSDGLDPRLQPRQQRSRDLGRILALGGTV